MLSNAVNAEELLKLHAEHGPSMNSIHLATLWNRMVSHRGLVERRQEQVDEMLRQTMTVLSSGEAQALSNIAHGVARCGLRGPEVRQFFESLLVSALRLLHTYNAQNLSNTVWAFATVACAAPELFARVEEAAMQKLADFNTQNLANTTWAYATLAVPAPRLFAAVEQVALPMLGEFKPQELSNLVYAYAKAGVAAPQLFSHAERAALSKLELFKAQDISNTAYAYALAGVGRHTPALFDGMVAQALRREKEFKAQEISNTVWAYATAEFRYDGADGKSTPRTRELYDGMAVAAARRLHDYKPQEIANTCWAYAKANAPAPALLARLARMAAPRIGDFKLQEVAILAWAFATHAVPAPELFEAIATELSPRMADCEQQGLANLTWAFACADARHRAFNVAAMAALVGRGVAEVAAFHGMHLAQLQQWQLWIEHELNEPSLLLPDELRAPCRAALASNSVTTSKLQSSVGRALLEGVGVLTHEEHMCERSGYSIDLVTTGLAPTAAAAALGEPGALAICEQRKVAIEVDGLSHFTQAANGNYAPTGATLFKARQLAALGWRCVSVPFYEWQLLERRAAPGVQAQYLRWLLELDAAAPCPEPVASQRAGAARHAAMLTSLPTSQHNAKEGGGAGGGGGLGESSGGGGSGGGGGGGVSARSSSSRLSALRADAPVFFSPCPSPCNTPTPPGSRPSGSRPGSGLSHTGATPSGYAYAPQPPGGLCQCAFSPTMPVPMNFAPPQSFQAAGFGGAVPVDQRPGPPRVAFCSPPVPVSQSGVACGGACGERDSLVSLGSIRESLAETSCGTSAYLGEDSTSSNNRHSAWTLSEPSSPGGRSRTLSEPSAASCCDTSPPASAPPPPPPPPPVDSGAAGLVGQVADRGAAKLRDFAAAVRADLSGIDVAAVDAIERRLLNEWTEETRSLLN